MTLTLVYDGGCPFCREFALRTELTSGIDNLEIRVLGLIMRCARNFHSKGCRLRMELCFSMVFKAGMAALPSQN